MTSFIQPNLLPALPEMVMLGMACLVLVVDLFLPQEKRGFTLLLSLLTLILVGFATVYVAPASSISTFGDSFVLDVSSAVALGQQLVVVEDEEPTDLAEAG